MRPLLALAFVLGLAGVVVAALGAHVLAPDAELVAAERIAVLKDYWRTGTSFLFFHVFAAIACAVLSDRVRMFLTAGWILMIGGVLFASGIWIGALSEVHDLLFTQLGIMAPIGGITMMAGWLTGAVAALRMTVK